MISFIEVKAATALDFLTMQTKEGIDIALKTERTATITTNSIRENPFSFEQKIINISNRDLSTHKLRVKVFILKDCPWSKRATRLLNSLSIPHDITLIDNDESFQKIMAQSSHNTFPQIFLDNKFFGGYDELSEQAKLDNLISFK